MLEVMLDRQVLFLLVGVCAAAGIVSKIVVSYSLGRLTKAAENMGKSSHPLMKLVRARFEHACMVSDKVQNVKVFVDKYIYEYKVLGVRLHGWRRLERMSAWACPVLGLFSAAGEYVFRGMSELVLQKVVFGAGIGVLLFLMRAAMDENYRMMAVRTYMVDYLENIYARRLEKNREFMAGRERGREVEEARDARDAGTPRDFAADKEREQNPELDNPERPRPRKEVPMPKEKPELDPPAMPEPYRAPESASGAEMQLAERAGSAGASDLTGSSERTAMGGAPVMVSRGQESGQTAQADPADEDWSAREAIPGAEKTSGKQQNRSARRQAERAGEHSGERGREPRSKEVMIREILEEFLA